jgi:hypothetical protein
MQAKLLRDQYAVHAHTRRCAWCSTPGVLLTRHMGQQSQASVDQTAARPPQPMVAQVAAEVTMLPHNAALRTHSAPERASAAPPQRSWHHSPTSRGTRDIQSRMVLLKAEYI